MAGCPLLRHKTLDTKLSAVTPITVSSITKDCSQLEQSVQDREKDVGQADIK